MGAPVRRKGRQAGTKGKGVAKMTAPIKLSAADRYNPEAVPPMEQYVDQQIASKTFDLSTNLVLLRMYQFFPERTNSTVLVKVLVKALTQLPGNDFALCVHLVPHHFPD